MEYLENILESWVTGFEVENLKENTEWLCIWLLVQESDKKKEKSSAENELSKYSNVSGRYSNTKKLKRMHVQEVFGCNTQF